MTPWALTAESDAQPAPLKALSRSSCGLESPVPEQLRWDDSVCNARDPPILRCGAHTETFDCTNGKGEYVKVDAHSSRRGCWSETRSRRNNHAQRVNQSAPPPAARSNGCSAAQRPGPGQVNSSTGCEHGFGGGRPAAGDSESMHVPSAAHCSPRTGAWGQHQGAWGHVHPWA